LFRNQNGLDALILDPALATPSIQADGGRWLAWARGRLNGRRTGLESGPDQVALRTPARSKAIVLPLARGRSQMCLYGGGVA
jgi:hypothetical protein